MSLVSKKELKKIASYLKEITGSSSLESARKRIRETVDVLEISYPKVAEFLDTYGEEILGVYSLPDTHRKRMRSTNMLERYNQEIKRRTRVVRIFPNEQSCIRLVSALAIETNEEWMARQYLKMNQKDDVSETVTDGLAAC